ncbi:unnamed protein product [Ectocarpus sp. CCAP 1310/34]|nr:unnamed protein product [Ectocarpus sp. CCAP 1310/34]
MRPPLAKTLAACKHLVLTDRAVRRWIGLPFSTTSMLAKRGGTCCFARSRSIATSTTSRGGKGGAPEDGERGSAEFWVHDIADLNKDISGFVGDLGDPDFDTTPSPPPARAVSGSRRNAQAEREDTPAAFQESQTRLTLADHPGKVEGLAGERDEEIPMDDDWSTSFVKGYLEAVERKSSSGSRARRSVLVLNGPACFIAGTLASTGEPRGAVASSMEDAAQEFNLSLTVCTSNREDELLDRLCEGGYDAVVYNPSGFSNQGLRVVVPTAAPTHQMMTDASPASNSSGNAAHTEPAEDGFPQSQQSRVDDPRHKTWHDNVPRHSGSGSALEYGLERAGCPVVIISPGRDGNLGANMLQSTSRGPDVDLGCRSERGAEGIIAGFSGAVSYRLAMAAVSSVLDGFR